MNANKHDIDVDVNRNENKKNDSDSPKRDKSTVYIDGWNANKADILNPKDALILFGEILGTFDQLAFLQTQIQSQIASSSYPIVFGCTCDVADEFLLDLPQCIIQEILWRIGDLKSILPITSLLVDFELWTKLFYYYKIPYMKSRDDSRLDECDHLSRKNLFNYVNIYPWKGNDYVYQILLQWSLLNRWNVESHDDFQTIYYVSTISGESLHKFVRRIHELYSNYKIVLNESNPCGQVLEKFTFYQKAGMQLGLVQLRQNYEKTKKYSTKLYDLSNDSHIQHWEWPWLPGQLYE